MFFYLFCELDSGHYISLQLRDKYMTRQLSFAGVTFDLKDLPLSKDFIEMYNDTVKLVSGTCVIREMM